MPSSAPLLSPTAALCVSGLLLPSGALLFRRVWQDQQTDSGNTPQPQETPEPPATPDTLTDTLWPEFLVTDQGSAHAWVGDRTGRLDPFGSGDVGDVVDYLKVLLGLEHGLSPSNEALVRGVASTVLRQDHPGLQAFLRRYEQDATAVNALLAEHRRGHPSRQDGDPLHEMLGTVFPDGLPEAVGRPTARVRPEDQEFPAPVNPWLLFQEGEQDAAVQALLTAVGWAPDLEPEARVLLGHFR